MSKILYIFDASDWESRMEVAALARAQGFEVVIGVIGDQHLKTDFKIISLPKGARILRVMYTLIRAEKPDILHVVTLKYSFIAGLAALMFAKMRKIFTLAGLGYLFRSEDVKSRILRIVLRPFMTFVFRRKNTTLIFQNPDDLELFVDGRYALQKQCILIRGSGVYLDRFAPVVSDATQTPIVLMPTRLVHEKGVAVFINAARILKTRGVEAYFQIAGGETKHNPKAISRAQMEEMVADASVEWLGRVSDMADLLSKVHVVVYPSYYGEGIPRVLLESCAAGRAIVTTDHPGCREAVAHKINGLLVPVKNAEATADAIEIILGDHTQRHAMEIESRKRAEAQFDIYDVAKRTVELYH